MCLDLRDTRKDIFAGIYHVGFTEGEAGTVNADHSEGFLKRYLSKVVFFIIRLFVLWLYCLFVFYLFIFIIILNGIFPIALCFGRMMPDLAYQGVFLL